MAVKVRKLPKKYGVRIYGIDHLSEELKNDFLLVAQKAYEAGYKAGANDAFNAADKCSKEGITIDEAICEVVKHEN